MKELNLLEKYSRQDIHSFFDSSKKFTPRSGTWGIHGIIRINKNAKDYVFIATYNQDKFGYTYDEKITKYGTLDWTTSPKYDLKHESVEDFINHDPSKNNIYLFYRDTKNDNYTYYGRLAYLSHDTTKEKPVHITWQLIDWDTINEMMYSNIAYDSTVKDSESKFIVNNEEFTLMETPPPLNEVAEEQLSSTKKFVDMRRITESNYYLGQLGEKIVLNHEINILRNLGFLDLVSDVQHTSQVIGDGTGFDIRSFDEKKQVKYIEVKTTTGPIDATFDITQNELSFSNENSLYYELYRLYDLDLSTKTIKFYKIPGNLNDVLSLKPISFRANYKQN